MINWAIEPTVFKQLENLRAKPPALATQVAVEAARKPMSARLDGVTAVVPIQGILTKAPDWIAAWLYGANTVYADVVAAIRDADNDPRVENIVLDVDSPGGTISGLFDTMAAISVASKPVHARVNDLAASAAYGLASQADTITVNNPAAAVGSVGVVYSTRVFEEDVDITSTEAPNKRPDLTTDEGRAVIQAELDAIHEQFAGRIAAGRGKTLKIVNATFGRGGMVLADAAVAAGMVDGIEADSNEPEAIEATTEMEVHAMTLAEFQAAHPDLFKQVTETAKATERDRVSALLTIGEASGAMDYAIECINDGSAIATDSVQAKFMAARMTTAEVVASTDDDPEVVTPPVEPDAETKQGDFNKMVATASKRTMKGEG